MSEHAPSYYAATANDQSRHGRLEGEQAADVCVIGGGYTGLSAALHLAERGYDVALLESERIGWGASGRNGGQICTAYNKSMKQVEALVDKEGAKTMWDIEVQSKDLIRERVQRHAIDCDLTWGYLHTMSKPGHTSWARETRDEWAEYGYTDTKVLSKAELEERLGTDVYHGALWEGNAGHLHPLNYALGLARAAGDAGVRLFERSPVTDIAQGASAKVSSAAGSVTAKYVVLAGNAYLGRLVPSLFHRVMPVGSFIVASEPLAEERARSLIRDNDAVTNSLFIVDYFRLSADHRLLFGGRANYSGYEPKNLFPYMRPRMLKVFPQLADVGLEYCWGGNIAITLNRFPHVGSIGGNMFYAHGYSGHGLALSGMCGKVIAEAVAGTAERFDVMAKIRHQPFPGGPIRMPMLTLGMLYFKLKDILS